MYYTYLTHYAHRRYEKLTDLVLECREEDRIHGLSLNNVWDRIESTLRLERFHFQVVKYRWKYWNAIYDLLKDFVSDPVQWLEENRYKPIPHPTWFYHQHHLDVDTA